MTKKRKTDDVFKLYRSAVKQYPILRMVVATKCVEYLHQFEIAQHYYNVELKFQFKVLTKLLEGLSEEEKQIRLMIVESEKNVLIYKNKVFFKADDSDKLVNKQQQAIKEYDLEQLKTRLDDVVIEQKKVQEEINNISIKGKVCQLDFSNFITVDIIIRNTFEIGLVTDERKKGDVVGRKGILAADLTYQETVDEDELLAE